MKPAPFRMLRPRALDEALELLAEHAARAKIIAGGQSLVPLMNLRMATPEILIDLARIDELRGIGARGDDLVIGAMTRQRELLADPLVQQWAPLLGKAVCHIGHVQTRARGTIGGSIAHADPAAELPMVMAALGATMVIRRRQQQREVPASAFFLSALSTVLAEDEILCQIKIPKAPENTRSVFRELARRHGDFAIVSVALQVCGDRASAKLIGSIGGISEVPHVCCELNSLVPDVSRHADDIEAAVNREIAHIDVLTDIYATADYRRSLAAVLLTDCLHEVLPT
jgi:CO/xanthine dehydrogenase FAD-binding subunit